MRSGNSIVVFASLAALTLASPQLGKRDSFTGYASFNDYVQQGNIQCKSFPSGITQYVTAANGYNYNGKIFGTATSDISNLLTAGSCTYQPEDTQMPHDLQMWWYVPL